MPRTAPVAPVMYGPSTSSLAAARGSTATNFPPYITAMRSESARISASSADTSRIALPALRACAQLRVNELDRAHVHAARRLRGEQHLKRAAHLARDDDLLLVAARQRARRQRRIGGPDVERLDLLRARSREFGRGRAATPRVNRCCWPRMRFSATV